jgi:hypothetical protein
VVVALQRQAGAQRPLVAGAHVQQAKPLRALQQGQQAGGEAQLAVQVNGRQSHHVLAGLQLQAQTAIALPQGVVAQGVAEGEWLHGLFLSDLRR